MQTKINIAFKISEGPWGGGNQFLKSLKNWLCGNGSYSQRPQDAGIIIFNSHQELLKVLWLKLVNPRKAFVHRLDNLMFVARENGRGIDRLIILINDIVAEGTVFQSEWSRNKFREQGLKQPEQWAIIHNAPDPSIFCAPVTKRDTGMDRKTRLIATSWSPNPRKGFALYSYLDERLDFNKYSMTFVGNSPVNFKNINQIPPVASRELSDILRSHDIFISASINEACPNSLLEAIHCGLVPVVIDSGSHAELINRQGGLIFGDTSEILASIDKAAGDIEDYRKNLRPETVSDIAHEYLEFCKLVSGSAKRKRLGLIAFLTTASRVIIGKLRYRFTLA